MIGTLSAFGLPPEWRLVTCHDAEGRARFRSDETAPTCMAASGDASFLTICAGAAVVSAWS